MVVVVVVVVVVVAVVVVVVVVDVVTVVVVVVEVVYSPLHRESRVVSSFASIFPSCRTTKENTRKRGKK